jgi:hypothetical protein
MKPVLASLVLVLCASVVGAGELHVKGETSTGLKVHADAHLDPHGKPHKEVGKAHIGHAEYDITTAYIADDGWAIMILENPTSYIAISPEGFMVI